MFCPQCKAEYRPGFTRCVDCDLDLVDEMPRGTSASSDQIASELGGKLESVWSGEDQSVCVSICGQLRASGIPFKVDQKRRQFLKGVDEHFTIAVPPAFSGDARKIVAEGALDFTDEPDDQTIMELPEPADSELTPSGHGHEGRTSARQTREVLCKNVRDNGWMIEAALRENQIHYRAEAATGNAQRFIVSVNDESRVREIIAEIESGKPPT